MIIANLECLPCARHFAKHFALMASVSSLHRPVYSPLIGKQWCHEWNQFVYLTLTTLLCILSSSHLPGWQKGPQCFLSAWTPAGSSLAGNDLAFFAFALLGQLVQHRAQLGMKLDAKAFTATPSVSLQPSSGPLASCFCFSCCAPVYFVPLFLKLLVVFFCELGEEDNYHNYFGHPFEPQYSLRQGPHLPYLFWLLSFLL